MFIHKGYVYKFAPEYLRMPTHSPILNRKYPLSVMKCGEIITIPKTECKMNSVRQSMSRYSRRTGYRYKYGHDENNHYVSRVA